MKAILMVLLSIIPALFIYSGIQENIDGLPALNLPDFFVYVTFICLGLIIILQMFMKKRN